MFHRIPNWILSNKIYPEVFSPDVDELREEEAPVEGELQDVVPPDVAVDGVVRVVGPAVADVPEPLLAPKTDLKSN